MKNTSFNIYKTLRWRYFIAIIQMVKMRLRELRNLLKITSSAWIWSQMELQSFCPCFCPNNAFHTQYWYELKYAHIHLYWSLWISVIWDIHKEICATYCRPQKSNDTDASSCGNSSIYNNEKEQAGDSKCFNKIIVCHITFLVEEQFDTDRSFNIYRNKHTLPPSEICHDLWII